MKQESTLVIYMEKFQILISALQLSKIEKSTVETVRQFIDGLKNYDDRIQMLTRQCCTLEEFYSLVTLIRGAKSIANTANESSPSPVSKTDSYDRNFRDRKRFQRLEGALKEKAISEGACLECGSTGHWWHNCPNLKPKGFGLEKAGPTRPNTNTRKKKAYVHDGAAA